MERHMDRTQRYDNLDLLKAIAMVMVIAIHTNLWTTGYEELRGMNEMLRYAMRLLSEGVPFFIMVNGFLLFRKEGIRLKQHLQKIYKLFFLFVFWSFFMASTALWIHGEALDLRQICDIVFRTEVGSPYTGVLWFLQNLIALYFVYPILKFVYDKWYEGFFFTFLIVIVFSVGTRTIELMAKIWEQSVDISLVTGFLRLIEHFNPIANRWYLLYFMLGAVVVHEKEGIQNKRILWSIVGGISSILAIGYGLLMSHLILQMYDVNYNFESVFMPFIVLGGYALTIPYKNEKSIVKDIIADIGKNTMGIYLLHMNVIVVIDKVLRLEGTWGRACVTALTLILSFVMTIILKKIPLIHHVVDMSPLIRKNNR